MATGTNNTGTKPIDLELVFNAIITGSPIDMNELLIDNKKPVRIPVVFEASDPVHMEAYDNLKIRNNLLAQSNVLSERGYEILKDSESLSVKRLVIQKQFADMELAMRNNDGSLKKGVTEDDIKELHQERDTAMEPLDEQSIAIVAEVDKWLKEIANYSLKQLEEAFLAVETELTKLKEAEILDPEAIALAEAKSEGIAKKIESIRAEQHFKSWEAWYKVLNTIPKEITNVGKIISDSLNNCAEDGENAWADIIGGAFSAASDITSHTLSIINACETWSKASAKSAEVTADASAKAVAKAERGSAILTIISVAIQLVQKIVSIIGNEQKQVREFNEGMAEANRELEKMKINALIAAKSTETIFGKDAWGKAASQIKAANAALGEYSESAAKLTGAKAGEPLDKKKLANAVANMEMTVRKGTWFNGGGEKRSIGESEELAHLFKRDSQGNITELDMDAVKTFIKTKPFEQLSKEERKALEQLSDDAELYKSAMTEVSKYLDSIFGKLGETMTNALVDAFQNGTDSAKEFTKSVTGMLENMAKDMMYSTLLQPLFEDANKKMQAIMMNEQLTDEEKFAQVASAMDGLGRNINGIQDHANRFLESMQKGAAEAGFTIFEKGAKDAETKGIAQASQDSVDELNGRMTAVQGHTDSLMKDTKELMKNSGLLVIYSSESLQCVKDIRTNTEELYAMRSGISAMRSSLDTMNERGVKVRTS